MPGTQTKQPLRLGRWLLIATLFGAASGGIQRWMAQRAASQAIRGLPTREYPDSVLNVRAPAGVRVKVEVLNATKTRGLARKASTYLRDRGFDVVYMGTSREQRTKTLVLDRSKHPQWTILVAKSMNASWESRPDTTKYLDATVFIGADWVPPVEPFYP